jgi:glutathione-regulated potassium-efflux system ancillary protein KefF
MKLWQDEVLGFGWAYGPGGRALRGKALWLVSSTGGAAEAYRPEGTHRHVLDDFLLPYRQTATLTGMRWLPPLVLHGAHRADDAALQSHAAQLTQRLQRWPEDLEPAGPPEDDCAVPADERPAPS